MQYHVKPSELLGLDDPYVAWCLDEATYMWGSHVDHEVDRAGHKKQKGEDALKNKRLLTLNRLLDAEEMPLSVSEPVAETPNADVPKGKFRDPATMFR